MSISSFIRAPGTMLSLGMFISGTVGFFAVQAEQPTFNVVFARCVFGAITLFTWALLSGGRKSLSGFQDVNWWLVIASGILLVLNWVALFEAFKFVSIGFATIIYHLQPFWIVIAGSIFLNERMTLRKLQWLAVGFTGLVLTVLPKIGGFNAEIDWVWGFTLALAASFLYACTILTTRAVRVLKPEVFSGFHCLIGIFLIWPFIDYSAASTAGTQTWLSLATMGAIHTGLVYVLIYSAYKHVSIIMIAMAAFLNPAAALLTDYFAFGQTISVLQAMGLIFILLAGLAINLGWRGLVPPRNEVI